MEHIHRNINQLGQFEVTLEQDTMPTPERTFVVQVTNETNRTYFHGPRWIEMMERYRMEPRTKCHFYMDGVFGHTYFYYKDRATSSSSDGEYHDPRDADGVIVHYPPAEAEEAKPDV